MHGGIPFMVFFMFRPFPVYLSEHLASLQLNYIAACFHLTLRTNTTPSSYTRICARTHHPLLLFPLIWAVWTQLCWCFSTVFGAKTHRQIYISINNDQQRLVCNKDAIPFSTLLKAKKNVKRHEKWSNILIKTFWKYSVINSVIFTVIFQSMVKENREKYWVFW